MEHLNELFSAYFGQDMEEEYADYPTAYYAYLSDNEEDDIKKLIVEIDKCLVQPDVVELFSNHMIENNFEDDDDQLRVLLTELKRAALEYLDDK